MTTPAQTLTVRVPFAIRKRGGRKLTIVADGSTLAPPRPRADSKLVKALARAHRGTASSRASRYGSAAELAAAEKINPSYVSRVLRLSLLAPDLVEAIVEGRQANGMEAALLLQLFSTAWHEQRRAHPKKDLKTLEQLQDDERPQSQCELSKVSVDHRVRKLCTGGGDRVNEGAVGVARSLMELSMHLFPKRLSLFAAIGTATLFYTFGLALPAAGEVVISQKSKQFQPGSVTLEKGQPLVIANDDEGTVHHAYVESDGFNFDTGDQNPGSRTKIVFPIKGDFQVLCGIHPGMKLAVHVK